MTDLLVLFVVIALMLVLDCCRTSGICAEEESRAAAQQNPCETCLRWEECNGVDKECPLCNGQNRGETE